MTLDRNKRFAKVQVLLKEKKTDLAISELRGLARDPGADHLVLNRVGDALVGLKQLDEAAACYQRIADDFAESGFTAKAVAILKKILRLDPSRTEVLERMGDLYLEQQLPGEARVYLLPAAERFLAAKQVPEARAVYEKLVVAEPDNPLHRARLAETRALEGDGEGAGEDFLELAETLIAAERFEEALTTCRRAAEVVPEHPGPLARIARCLSLQGKPDEAVAVLQEAMDARGGDPVLLGELAVLHGSLGNVFEIDRLLSDPVALDVPDEILEKMLRHEVDQDNAEVGWERIDTLISRWNDSDERRQRVPDLLRRMARLETRGHLPALTRLCDDCEARGDSEETADALELLIGAYRSHGKAEEAGAFLDRLRKVRPKSRLLVKESAAKDSSQKKPKAAVDTSSVTGAVSVEVPDPPAVPIEQADLEFVSGRLTEAEVFRKYGLEKEAIEQLREAVDRFPGHVEAQERLSAVLAATGDRAALARTLADLAIARNASGDVQGAKDAARNAAELELPDESRGLLATLSLFEPARETAAPQPKPKAKPRKAKKAPKPEDDDVEVVFEFGDEDDEAVAAEAPVVATATATQTATAARAEPASEGRTPPGDLLEEIASFVDRGEIVGARQKIDALRTLGFGGSQLDDLDTRLAGSEASESPGVSDPVVAPSGSFSQLDEDDLGAITAALESGFGTDEPPAQPAEAQTFDEESLEDVFQAFKSHVDTEVGSDDHKTHYDLGIAYKEMGLIDDALGEFRVATGSSELFRDSCIMLAVCHRERGEIEEAVDWYRKALGEDEREDETQSGLRYDLAEALLQTGDEKGALDLFRHVLETDPSYRDVQERIDEIQSRQGS